MNLYFIKDEDDEVVGVYFTRTRNTANALQAAGANDVVMPQVALVRTIEDDSELDSLDGEMLLL